MVIERIVVGELEANCYIVYNEVSLQALIIDPGGDASKIKIIIDRKKLKCLFIINTHGHIDHIGANNEFDIPIMVHEADEEFLYNPELNLSMCFGFPYSSRKAEKILEGGEMFDFSGLSFETIHTPGHTPGSICLKFDNHLFTGDTIFFQGIGRTDFPHSSEDKLLKSIKEKIFTLDAEIKIFPGHGPTSTIGAEKNFSSKIWKNGLNSF
ncbi:MAG: MBL fold metallo-hydrolase [Candidatus Omnitrophica bacterium]|nr:MBL fold metallo-hydrolase [Candidatus Omnitrophota bacterium]